MKVKVLLLAICLAWSYLPAIEGQLQYTTYYDSNVGEAVDAPDQTFGVSVRGRLRHEMQIKRSAVFVEVVGQALLDPVYNDETKYILSTDLALHQAINHRFVWHGYIRLYEKLFLDHNGAYSRSQYNTSLELLPSSRVSIWLTFRHRAKSLDAYQRFRFAEDNLELKAIYKIAPRLKLEALIGRRKILHRDVYAVSIGPSNDLVVLSARQRDWGYYSVLHLHYGGKLILGARIGMEDINSNSALGRFQAVFYQFYLSSRLPGSLYAHLVLRRLNKEYRSPLIEGQSLYQDPEEPLQDLMHLRIERELTKRTVSYMQISLVRNETTLTQRYYNKTFLELGAKYAF